MSKIEHQSLSEKPKIIQTKNDHLQNCFGHVRIQKVLIDTILVLKG